MSDTSSPPTSSQHDTVPPPACNDPHVVVDGPMIFCQLVDGHAGSHRAAHDGAAVGWTDEPPPICDATDPIRFGFICTLSAGHAGMHEAWDDRRCCHTWGAGADKPLIPGLADELVQAAERMQMAVTFLERLRAAGINTREAAGALAIDDRDRILSVGAWCGIEDQAWKQAISSLVFEGSRCGLHGDDTSSGRCVSCDEERPIDTAAPTEAGR